MGVQAGKSNTDTTGESSGQSQYQNAGGQQAAGSNSGYTNIQYLDPNAIASQKWLYSGLLGKSQGDTADTFGKASQFYGGLLNSPGYDEGTKNAISAIGNAAANEKLDEGRANAERHAAATGNDAGYTAGLSNLYGQGAADAASRANQNQLAFYQEQQRQKELGGQGLQNLYGTAQGAQLGLLGGMNNLSTLGSGTTSGGQYENAGSQYGNGSATNQNTMHNASQTTHTGGEGDAANGIGNLLQSLFGKSGSGSSGSGGGLGGALGSLLGGLFGGGNSTGSLLGKGLADGLGRMPGDPNYDPTTVQGVNDYNPLTTDTYDPTTGQVTHGFDPFGGGGDPGDGGYMDPYGGDYGPQFDPTYDPSLDPYYDPWGDGGWGD